MDIEALVSVIRTTPNCSVYDPVGLPLVREGESLPDDLQQFSLRKSPACTSRVSNSRFLSFGFTLFS